MITVNGKNALICLDPGHGGHDPGAVGPSGVRESEMALKISKEVMFQLHELGIDSHLTRTEDEFISLSGRVEASKKSDCFVSIHCNSFSSPAAQGIETIYGAAAGKHKALANYVQQALLKYCQGHKDRGIKMSPSDGYPRSLFVLSAAKVPACLVEVEFLSNPEWEKWINSDEGQNKIGYAIAQGIKSFLMSLPGAKSDDRKTERLQLADTAAPKMEQPKEVQQAPVMEAGAAGQLATETAKQIVVDAESSISEPSNEVEKIEVGESEASGDDSSGGSKLSGLKRKSKRKSKS